MELAGFPIISRVPWRSFVCTLFSHRCGVFDLEEFSCRRLGFGDGEGEKRKYDGIKVDNSAAETEALRLGNAIHFDQIPKQLVGHVIDLGHKWTVL